MDDLKQSHGKLGFVTAADLSYFYIPGQKKSTHFGHDDQAAADFLEKQGFSVAPIVWSGSPAEIKRQGFDLIIMRSPWDYSHTPENRRRFFDWMDQVKEAELPIQNDIDLMLWNLDKHYLKDLEADGVAIVPTQIIEEGSSFDVVEAFESRGPLVVKPCISAGARDTFRVTSLEEATDLSKKLAKLRDGFDFMLQPYLPEIETKGEWSLVFLDGRYSHAVHKLPKNGGWLVQDELGGSVESKEPAQNILAAANAAFAAIDPAPLYARVDVIETANGCLVGEVELVEPELFFLQRLKTGTHANQSALALFCDGIEKRI